MNKLRHTNSEAGSTRALVATRAASVRPAGVAPMTTDVIPGAFHTGTPDALDPHRRPRIE